MTDTGYLAVIGGISVDLHATPVSSDFERDTSTPSRVTLSAGGVGRNIAANLGVLGVPVRLFGATGDDPLSEYALKRGKDAGVDVSGVRRMSGTQGGIYIALLDPAGNLEAAAADLSAIETLGRDYVEEIRAQIEGAQLAITETNLMPDLLQAVVTIAEEAGVPLIIDPVSNEKARRLESLSGTVFALTPNEAEARVCEQAAGLRARHTILTLGSRGLRWTDHETGQTQDVPARQAEQVDATGAGDAFTAGFAGALFDGASMQQALDQGIEVAARVVAGHSSTLEEQA